jgi:acyl carrier protein
MSFDREPARTRIRARIAELAAELGRNASRLGDDDVIPQTGLLDSAGILALIVWCEQEFGVALELDEINIDNFGSVNRMLDHVARLTG